MFYRHKHKPPFHVVQYEVTSVLPQPLHLGLGSKGEYEVGAGGLEGGGGGGQAGL